MNKIIRRLKITLWILQGKTIEVADDLYPYKIDGAKEIKIKKVK